jgi:hypothetical protein
MISHSGGVSEFRKSGAVMTREEGYYRTIQKSFFLKSEFISILNNENSPTPLNDTGEN